MEEAMFGAGCFWGVQSEFNRIKGVTHTEVGYAGGHQPNPTYEQVCTGKTGHAEVVNIKFDPKTISYKNLLETFWKTHDPTQINRQGPDVGSQYRSVIFYFDNKQKEVAEKYIKEQSQNLDQKIATSIEPATKFWKAEEYHQNYLEKNDA